MKLKLTFFALLTTSFLGFCQTSFKLPKGFSVKKDLAGKFMSVKSDFDGDMIYDYACVMTNKTGDKEILGFFISSRNEKSMYSYIEDNSLTPVFLEYKNNTLTLGTGDGRGRANKAYRLKYYSKYNDFRLIGYEFEQFPDVYGEFYNKSFNLLTGYIELNSNKTNGKKKYKSKFPLITSAGFNEKTNDMLDNLGSEYL